MSRILKDKRANRGDTRRESIVRAAREICLEKGFSKITVSDIASKVGMTRSLFYHYFNDKDAVADAVLDDVIDEILTKLEEWNQAREIGNVNKALDEIVLVLRSLIADESPFSNRMIQDATPNCTSNSSTRPPTASQTTSPRPQCATSSRCMGCQSPTSTRRSSRSTWD